LNQFADVIVGILLIAAFLSFILNESVDGYIILGIVFINAMLGFYQEFKAEKAIEKLSKSSSQNATVVRDGIAMILPSKDLVP
jgi:Ca2+-transporting ATPase